MTSLTIGGFGKLPGYGDFIRVHGEASPVALIERWVASAAIEEKSPRAQAFLAGGPTFAVTSHAGHWWGIALFPSHDQVGRIHPFALFAGLPIASAGHEVGVLPLLFIPFFQQALQAAQGSWPSTVPAVRERILALHAQVDARAEEARLIGVLDGALARDLWQGLLGRWDPERARAVVAHLLAAVQTPAVHGLRIQPMSHQAHLCFWLMLVWLARPQPTPPVLLAMQPGGPSQTSAAGVLWDRPQVHDAATLLWPAAAREPLTDVLDLATGEGPVLDVPPLPPLEALEDPELPLRDLLHALAAVGRQPRGVRAR